MTDGGLGKLSSVQCKGLLQGKERGYILQVKVRERTSSPVFFHSLGLVRFASRSKAQL